MYVIDEFTERSAYLTSPANASRIECTAIFANEAV